MSNTNQTFIEGNAVMLCCIIYSLCVALEGECCITWSVLWCQVFLLSGEETSVGLSEKVKSFGKINHKFIFTKLLFLCQILML